MINLCEKGRTEDDVVAVLKKSLRDANIATESRHKVCILKRNKETQLWSIYNLDGHLMDNREWTKLKVVFNEYLIAESSEKKYTLFAIEDNQLKTIDENLVSCEVFWGSYFKLVNEKKQMAIHSGKNYVIEYGDVNVVVYKEEDV